MNRNRFLQVVPRTVQRWCVAVIGCAVVIGLAVGHHMGQQGPALRTMFAGGGIGLLGGSMAALWLLCLGFVYADARRRGMRPILWTVVAALIPHLLGFLLYFVLRQPIPSTCEHCGMTIALPQQPFCAWCGSSRTASSTNPRNKEPLAGTL